MSKVPPDPPLIEMKLEPEDESSSEGSSGSVSDSDDSEDLENSRKIQEFQEKVSYYLGIFKNSFYVGSFVTTINYTFQLYSNNFKFSKNSHSKH